MTTQCAVCNLRILANQWRCTYLETDDGNHRIGKYVIKVKRVDGSLDKCCRKCYDAAQEYVWNHLSLNFPIVKFRICVPFSLIIFRFHSHCCRPLQDEVIPLFHSILVFLCDLSHFYRMPRWAALRIPRKPCTLKGRLISLITWLDWSNFPNS